MMAERMRSPMFAFLFLTLFFASSLGLRKGEKSPNVLQGRPIIGVIAQEMRPGYNNKSWVVASYVKALEASGARVVPIFINKNESYYRTVLSYINGVVIPGGSSLFNVTGGFASASIYVYNIAKEINEKEGKIFPILGVCQGQEMLSYIASGQVNPLVPCEADNINLPLKFRVDNKRSKLFRNMSEEYLTIFKTKPVTNNHHEFCLTEKNFKKFNLDRDWTILTTNKDKNGLEFVSSIESKSLPFVGVQFHPEKPAYEWNSKQNNPHDYTTILVNRYFYDWVVNVAKTNDHHFPNKKTENDWLIYNEPITYTPNGYDMEMYFFKDNKFKSDAVPHIVLV